MKTKNVRLGADAPKLGAFLLGLFLTWASLPVSLCRGSTLLVTNLGDGEPGSMRAELATAQAGDTISFAVAGTIVLTNGQLLISSNLIIAGPGATNLAISAGGQSRVFEIGSNAAVSISSLTICDGHAADGATGTSNSPVGGNGSDGGGIYNAGSLALDQCIVSNCAAGNGGMGYELSYYNTWEGIIYDGTNWFGGAGGRGGAVYNSGKLVLTGSRLISNSSGAAGRSGHSGQDFSAGGRPGGGGGGIYNAGTLKLASCAFEINVAGKGGDAGFLDGSTFHFGDPVGGNPGGAGGNGGAVCDAGRATTSISDCQFSFNATGGGGIGTTLSMWVISTNGGVGGDGGSGGAVWAGNPVHMIRCTFLSNHTGAGAFGGHGRDNGGAGGSGGSGGAICVIGDLSLSDCLCASNHTGAGGTGGTCNGNVSGSGGSGGPGGAIYAASALQLDHCAFGGNCAGTGGQGSSMLSSYWAAQPGRGGMGGSGGAVYAANSLKLNQCTFSGNLAGTGGPGSNAPPFSIYYGTLAADGGPGGSGGGVYCQSKLTATACTFDRNQAGSGAGPGGGGFDVRMNGQHSTSASDGGQGGAIFGVGPLELRACTISGNVGGNGSGADYDSGALLAANTSSAAASEKLVNPNPHPNLIIYTFGGGPGGTGGAGGIYCENSLKLVLCTLSGNVGGAGGSGGNSGGGYFETLIGGAGGDGGQGAINCASSNELTLIACTLAGNQGGAGGPGGNGTTYFSQNTGQGSGGVGGTGGIFDTSAVSASVLNSIVASNVGGAGGASGPYRGSFASNGAPDVQGSFSSLGHNLIGQTDDTSGFTNGVNGDIAGSATAPLDPLLGPLADNGGPTLTMALLHGSPALDAGDDAITYRRYGLKYDQRGLPRKSGYHVDIGAFEFQYPARGAQVPASALTISGAMLPEGYLPSNSPVSASAAPAAGSAYQLTFNNSTPGATFSVLASTDFSLPLTNWSVLGQAIQISPGVFQFIDPDAANNPQRFYRVSSP